MSFLFQDRKTGKLRGKGKIALYSLLIAWGFMLGGASTFFMVKPICEQFALANLNWVYFSMTSLAAIAVGVFGSVFTTYASLYRAKDNDLLLSMPIPAFKILTARMVGVFLSALLFESVVYVPALVARMVCAPVSLSGGIFSVLLWLVLAVLITFLTLILGWVVALIAARVKHKTLITVIFFIVFVVLYYYVIFLIGEHITDFAVLGENMAGIFRNFVYPAYCFGIAAEGNAVAFIGYTAVTLALFALCTFVMSKTFTGIATDAKSFVGAKNKDVKFKVKTPSGALFSREAKRLFGNAMVFLNCAGGTIMIPLLSMVLLIGGGKITGILAGLGESEAEIRALILLLSSAFLLMFSLLNNISGPSVSLEAKTLNVLRAMPVKTGALFIAKEKLHFVMTVFPVAFGGVCFAVTMGANATFYLLLIADSVIFAAFGAAFSLSLGIKFANFNWTNETVAVKKGAGNMIAVLGGMLLAVAFGAGLYGLNKLIPVEICMAIGGALFAVFTVLLNLWIFKRGVEIFETL